MGDARETLARLNTPTIRYDIGRGGIPELTAQDVAGALGMVAAGIGRDLLHYLHGMGRVPSPLPQRLPLALDRQILDWQMDRRAEQQHRKLDCSLALELARQLADQHRRPPDDIRYRVIRLTEDYARARTACWPAESPVYRRLREAVVHELGGDCACDLCNGRGNMTVCDVVIACERCGGGGRNKLTGRRRSVLLDVDEANYRREWKAPYEAAWLFLGDQLSDATLQLRDALG